MPTSLEIVFRNDDDFLQLATITWITGLHVITAGDITNGYFTLPFAPYAPEDFHLSLLKGGEQSNYLSGDPEPDYFLQDDRVYLENIGPAALANLSAGTEVNQIFQYRYFGLQLGDIVDPNAIAGISQEILDEFKRVRNFVVSKP